jgi:hypothetical protein
VLTSSLPILEAYYYDQAISKLCEDYKASWVRVLPGVIIAQVTIEKQDDNKVRLGLSLDTPTVLLGVEYYADPITQRALNTRASILTQVIENYVISKVTGEPYYSEEEWASLPDNVRQDLEKILKELGVEPHGETNKESSIQELVKGETPEYNPTTGTVKIEKNGKKFVAGAIAGYLIVLATARFVAILCTEMAVPDAEGATRVTKATLEFAKMLEAASVAVLVIGAHYALRCPQFAGIIAIGAVSASAILKWFADRLKVGAAIGDLLVGSVDTARSVTMEKIAELIAKYLSPIPI